MEGRLSSYTKHVLKSTVLNCSISQQHLQCCPFTGKVVRKSDERWQRSLLGWGQSSRARGRVHWLGLQRPGWRNKRVKWGQLSNAVHYQEDGIGGGSGEQYQENGTGGGGSRSGDSVEDGDGSSQNGVSVGSKVGKYAASTAMAVKDSLPPEGVIVLLSCLVGLLTGGSVVLFNLVVHGVHDEVWKGIPQSGAAWFRTRPLNETWVRLVAVPVGGGVLVGLLNMVREALEEIKKEERGSTMRPGLADARAFVRALLKAVAAAITLGTGNSLGPEGPSVEIGASIANGVGTVLNNSRERKLSLVAAGSAAGISSGFNAAVAGCFFALESVLRSSTTDAVPSLTTAMLLLSSVLASVVSQAGLGSDPAFKIPAYDFRSPAELPLYLLLGILSGGVSVALVKGSAYATAIFDHVKKTTGIPAGLLPPVGGLSVGLIALAYPEILYWGFENVDVLLESQRPWVRAPPVDLLLQLVAAKLVATSLCRGSGLVGGVYAPSLFMGAALGSAYGSLAGAVIANADPMYHLDALKVAAPQAYALVGMAAMLAGVCQVPLTSVLLLFELTRDYRIILPLMGTVGVSSWIASSFNRKKKRSLVKQDVAMISSSTVNESAGDDNMPADDSLAPLTSQEKQSGVSNSAGNGSLQSNVDRLRNSLLMEENDICKIDASLCLTNLEGIGEQLAEEIPVAVAMRTKFATVGLEATIREAVAAMLLKKEWCVLLLDQSQQLQGLITLGDIQQAAESITAVGLEMEAESSIVAFWERAKSKQVVTATQGMSLRAALRLMTGRGLRQLPVLDASRQVVGMLDRDSIALACRAEATRRLLQLSISSKVVEQEHDPL